MSFYFMMSLSLSLLINEESFFIGFVLLHFGYEHFFASSKH